MLNKVLNMMMWLSIIAIMFGGALMGGQDVEFYIVVGGKPKDHFDIGLFLFVAGWLLLFCLMAIDDYFDNQDRIGGRS